MRLGVRSVLAIGGVVGAAVVASTAIADQGSAPEVPTAAQMAMLTPAEISLLQSGSPVDVVLDPSTGDIESVTPASSDVTSAIQNQSICDPGDGCYQTNKVPYANEGFYGGSGTYYGSWPYRSAYSSGNWTVSACWTTRCGLKIAPGSKVTFTSDVTGTSFTIY